MARGATAAAEEEKRGAEGEECGDARLGNGGYNLGVVSGDAGKVVVMAKAARRRSRCVIAKKGLAVHFHGGGDPDEIPGAADELKQRRTGVVDRDGGFIVARAVGVVGGTGAVVAARDGANGFVANIDDVAGAIGPPAFGGGGVVAPSDEGGAGKLERIAIAVHCASHPPADGVGRGGGFDAGGEKGNASERREGGEAHHF